MPRRLHRRKDIAQEGHNTRPVTEIPHPLPHMLQDFPRLKTSVSCLIAFLKSGRLTATIA
jgi:hypothetical protein